jgi:hypothetical protein
MLHSIYKRRYRINMDNGVGKTPTKKSAKDLYLISVFCGKNNSMD